MKLFVVVVAVAVAVVAVAVVAVVVVCFCFGGGGRGAGGQSALEFGGVVVGFFFRGDGGQSASSVWLAQRLTRVRKRALSGRDFVRKGFCQEGILSGRSFVREEFCQAGILPGSGLCQEAGSARKESLVFFWGERCEKLEAD